MAIGLYAPLALKLYTHGLSKLTDGNWTGQDLFYLLKRPVAEDRLLFRTLQNGLLYNLGIWFYREYVRGEGQGASGPVLRLRGEYLLWYLEDLLFALIHHGVEEQHELIADTVEYISTTSNLYDIDEPRYFDYLLSKEGRRDMKKRASRLRKEFSILLDEMEPLYATDYAERAFHDRQLCEFLCRVVILIGYPGLDENTGEPELVVDRRAIPAWAQRAVKARDRGLCASCGKDLVGELQDTPNIDHIIPLARGGSNDLANFQLLCSDCNSAKLAKDIPVRTSVPRYLQRQS